MTIRAEQMILSDSTHRPKLKPLRKGTIRKPYLFWSELLIFKLHVKKVTWSNELTIHEYYLDP
jgi:hypothetical protein